MASPTPGDFHRDAFLTNVMAGYQLPGLIARDIAPEIPVTKESGLYPVIERKEWWKVPETERAVGTAPKETTYSVGSGRYVTRNYELAHSVPFESIAAADLPYRPLELGTQFLRDQLDIDYERRMRTLVMSGVGSSVAVSGAQAWNNPGGSTPLDQIDAGCEAIRGATGYNPNVAVLSTKLWRTLRRHPDVVQAVFPAGVGAGLVSVEQFAQVIGVERVLLGQSIENVAPAGAAPVFRDVWSAGTFLLAYVAPNPGLLVPSYAYTFTWRGPEIGDGAPGAYQVFTRRDTKRKVIELQAGYYSDERIIFAECGFRIDTGVTA